MAQQAFQLNNPAGLYDPAPNAIPMWHGWSRACDWCVWPARAASGELRINTA